MSAGSRETRQARRRRERQAPKHSPSDFSSSPYLLMCRAEDEDGHGAWVMIPVDGQDDGHATARALQHLTNGLEDAAPTRCELVENSDAGLRRWAAANIKRREALRKWREMGVA